jgi:hypothetical protein
MSHTDGVAVDRTKFLARLDRDPVLFLSTVAWNLAIVTRGSYVEAGVSPSDAIRQLESLNEVLIPVLEQLGSLSRGEQAYPDDVLVDVLTQRAEVGGRSADLLWAADRAGYFIDRWLSGGLSDESA